MHAYMYTRTPARLLQPIGDRCWKRHINTNAISSLPPGLIIEQTRGLQGCRVLEAADAVCSKTASIHTHQQPEIPPPSPPPPPPAPATAPKHNESVWGEIVSWPTDSFLILLVSAAKWVFRRETICSKQQLVTCQSCCSRRRKGEGAQSPTFPK